jgi:hypothetical protein
MRNNKSHNDGATVDINVVAERGRTAKTSAPLRKKLKGICNDFSSKCWTRHSGYASRNIGELVSILNKLTLLTQQQINTS